MVQVIAGLWLWFKLVLVIGYGWSVCWLVFIVEVSTGWWPKIDCDRSHIFIFL